MKDQSGSAFPVALKTIGTTIAQEAQPGITQLEFFAAFAMMGFLARGGPVDIGNVAYLSFNLAKEMVERSDE